MDDLGSGIKIQDFIVVHLPFLLEKARADMRDCFTGRLCYAQFSSLLRRFARSKDGVFFAAFGLSLPLLGSLLKICGCNAQQFARTECLTGNQLDE